MATQAQQTELLTLLVGMFDAAPTAEIFADLEAALDSGASVADIANVIVSTEYFTGLYADADAFVAGFPAALIGDFVSAEVLADAEGFVAQQIENGASVADVIAVALTALSAVDAADETWGAAAAALNNKVTVAQYFVDNVAGSGLATVEAMQAVLSGVTQDAATVTTAQEAIDTDFAPVVPGETFTLTTGADAVQGTDGDDTIDGTTLNTLTANDLILDSSTTDNDTLNVTVNAEAAATITNIENVNYEWTSNADLAFTGTNVSGSTLNLTASSLAFTGNAAVTTVGDNNVNADSTIGGTLTLTDIKTTVVDSSASTINLDAAAVTTVGQTNTATINVNGNVSLTAGANALDTVTLQSNTADAGVRVANVATTIAVAGDEDLTVEAAVSAKTLTDSSTGTLVVNATDTGSVDLSKVQADTINLVAAATDVTVVNGQSLSVQTTGTTLAGGSAAGALNELKSASGTAAVSLSADGAITALDTKAIGNLAFTATKDSTISTLTVDSANNISVAGAGATTITSVVGNTAADAVSIDASAATGKFTATVGGDFITGLVGSSTAVNVISLANVATKNATVITGSANDQITLGASSGTLKVTTGAGDDTVTTGGTLSGTVTLDAGAGTGDKLVVKNATDLAADTTGASSVSFTGFEVLDVVTGTNFNNVQLSGSTATLTTATAQAQNATIDVFVYDKSGSATTSTTDLSGLKFDANVNQNVQTINITGLDTTADTIKGSSVNDVIDAGQGADIIDISQGGADIIQVANGDSTASKYDSITGFDSSSSSSAADKLAFTAATVGSNNGNVDVKSAISGGTGSEVVTATAANGIMTLSGANAGSINELSEYVKAASALLADANTTGNTVAFYLNGNTYVVNEGADAAATSDDVVVELVGITGDVLGTAAAADTIFVGAI